MTNLELAAKAKDIAQNYKTLYVLGCFGAPLKSSNYNRYTTNYSYNSGAARRKMIKAACDTNPTTFGFDCVCLIKGILWGWEGDSNANYGGADYASNGVPDISEDQMIKVCSGVSTDFSNVEIGEAVWMSGHIGIYIGDGLAVECTPKWDNCVQITACNCSKSGYNRRDWTKHGKLPYVTYEKATAKKEEPKPSASKEACPYSEPSYQLCRYKQEYGKIYKGDEGVKWLQWYLTKLGYYTKEHLGADADVSIDGFFGKNTEKCVKEFQQTHFDVYGNRLDVDGSVYVLTRGSLKAAY